MMLTLAHEVSEEKAVLKKDQKLLISVYDFQVCAHSKPRNPAPSVLAKIKQQSGDTLTMVLEIGLGNMENGRIFGAAVMNGAWLTLGGNSKDKTWFKDIVMCEGAAISAHGWTHEVFSKTTNIILDSWQTIFDQVAWLNTLWESTQVLYSRMLVMDRSGNEFKSFETIKQLIADGITCLDTSPGRITLFVIALQKKCMASMDVQKRYVSDKLFNLSSIKWIFKDANAAHKYDWLGLSNAMHQLAAIASDLSFDAKDLFMSVLRNLESQTPGAHLSNIFTQEVFHAENGTYWDWETILHKLVSRTEVFNARTVKDLKDSPNGTTEISDILVNHFSAGQDTPNGGGNGGNGGGTGKKYILNKKTLKGDALAKVRKKHNHKPGDTWTKLACRYDSGKCKDNECYLKGPCPYYHTSAQLAAMKKYRDEQRRAGEGNDSGDDGSKNKNKGDSKSQGSVGGNSYASMLSGDQNTTSPSDAIVPSSAPPTPTPTPTQPQQQQQQQQEGRRYPQRSTGQPDRWGDHYNVNNVNAGQGPDQNAYQEIQNLRAQVAQMRQQQQSQNGHYVNNLAMHQQMQQGNYMPQHQQQGAGYQQQGFNGTGSQNWNPYNNGHGAN